MRSLDPTPDRTVTACVLIIGNEILSGRTQDTNLAFLAKGLNAVGIRLREARVIPDVAETIIATVNEVRVQFDYVITTGGIGPTHDDITAECVARAFGVDLVLDAEAKRRLEVRYRDTNPGLELNEARLRMAHVPRGAVLVDNPVSAAPGFQIGNVFVLAGVPVIMQAMFDALKHRLVGGKPVTSRTVSCSLAEGTIAAALGAIQTLFPMIDIGSYPMYSRASGYRTSLVLRGTEESVLGEAVEAVRSMIREFGDEPVDVETT
jgi:molybdenum cofactor synthesis domain-containing protein